MYSCSILLHRDARMHVHFRSSALLMPRMRMRRFLDDEADADDGGTDDEADGDGMGDAADSGDFLDDEVDDGEDQYYGGLDPLEALGGWGGTAGSAPVRRAAFHSFFFLFLLCVVSSFLFCVSPLPFSLRFCSVSVLFVA